MRPFGKSAHRCRWRSARPGSGSSCSSAGTNSQAACICGDQAKQALLALRSPAVIFTHFLVIMQWWGRSGSSDNPVLLAR
jgi:hypothetical protein